MTRRPFHFTRAIVREPARSVVNGLSSRELVPDFERVVLEHRGYIDALRTAGLSVEVLAPLPAYPDSLFVEDAAFVLPEAAILLSPGAPSRAGEEREMAPALSAHFDPLPKIEHGMVDGGDILILPDEILVGLSERTDEVGAREFASWAHGLGRTVRIVDTPRRTLHLKSGCSLVDNDLILATPDLATSGMFDSFEIVVTEDGEANAANAIRVNDRLLVTAAAPRTAVALEQRGLNVVRLETREIEKLDAGLSCMSLRW